MAQVQQLIAGVAKLYEFGPATVATDITFGTGSLVTDGNYQVDKAGCFWQVTVSNGTAGAITFDITGITSGGIECAIDPAGSTINQTVAAGDAVNYLYSFYGPACKFALTAGVVGGGEAIGIEVKCATSIDDANLTLSPTAYVVP